MTTKEYSLDWAGRKMTATFSDLTNQANGSVMIRYGETVVLATAVMSAKTRDEIDYFPLTVDYEEKFYAVGKILGGRFIKREGRPSDEAILSGRIVDRTIRPLFDSFIRNEVQVVITVLSFDGENDPDVPAVIAASLALGTSDIPWHGPVGAATIGFDENKNFIINPKPTGEEKKDFDLLACGRAGKINMIESEGDEIPEDKMKEAFDLALAEITKIENWQKEIITEIGKIKKEVIKPRPSAEMVSLFENGIKKEIEDGLFGDNPKGYIYELQSKWLDEVGEKLPDESSALAMELFEEEVNRVLHSEGLTKERRVDGRSLDEVRSIYTKAGGLSDIVHGSGIFYRGETHILSVLTLSGPKDSQLIEGMEIQNKKYFMHHYNFPPFSTGETGRIGGTNRRAIGHGALAEKSLRAVLPDRKIFPYTIRLVSEAMASNGSTSMGSVCGSTLAMMDGGVPIKRPVAGIAIGLLLDETNEKNYKILTDIQGPEDHYGDMDFKVAGTSEGITGLQMDVKVGGIPVEILAEAMTKARNARLHIIEKIKETIAEPREKVKPSAPTITQLVVPTDKIGTIIGPGGKTIQKMAADTGAEIEIEDDGTVYITGTGPGVEMAITQITDIAREYKPGDRFEGEVMNITDFGAFVKIGYKTEGLVHVSEIAPFRVEKVTDFLQEGEKVPVVVKEVDDKGRIKLSIKQADPDFAEKKKKK